MYDSYSEKPMMKNGNIVDLSIPSNQFYLKAPSLKTRNVIRNMRKILTLI